jgi:hypothetical protein
MTPIGERGVLRRGVAVVAALDWLLAAVMLVTATRRELALPLLLLAVGTLAAVNRATFAGVENAIRAARNTHSDVWTTVENVLADRIGRGPARFVLREPRLLWSMVLLARRRYDGQPTPAWTAHRGALPTWLVLLGLAAIELAAAPLLPIPPWATFALLAAGVWALGVTFGLVAALVVHPHLVTPTELRVRTGCWDEIRLPRHLIVDATVEFRTAPRGLNVREARATLTPTGATNLTIRFLAPTTVGNGPAVDTVCVWADDPDGLRRLLTR